MQYNRIITNIVNGEHDDMEQFDNDREMLYNKIILLNNLYDNMSNDDKIVYKHIIMGYVNDIETEL